MCGRYVSARDDRGLIPLFDVDERVGDELRPSWNVAPTQQVRVVLDDAREGRTLRLLRNARWGLIPVWAKDPRIGARMINARSETVTEKPSFRSAATKRRCVVPADGYYEWQQQGTGKKTPYYLHPEGEAPLAFAGLYELWPDPEIAEDDPAKWVWSCTILTRPATDALGHIHDRTPVVLPLDMVGDWLDRDTTDKARVRQLIDAVPEPHLLPREVGTAVGAVRNNSAELIEPAA